MTTSFTLVQELITLMRARENPRWATEDDKKEHYETWALTLKLAQEHQAVESERVVIRKLTEVMEMQDKRESGEFHISGWSAWSIWGEAKSVAEKYLIEQSTARLGISVNAFAEFAEKFPTVESRVQPGTAPAITQIVEPATLAPITVKVITETAIDAEGYLKKRAEALGRELKKMGVPLKHGQLLKLLAVTEGYKGFSALKVALAGDIPGFCPHCGAAGTLRKSGDVFCEQGEYDGKQYEAEGDGVQYKCTRCTGQFTDWCGIETVDAKGDAVPLTFDVNVYESHQDFVKSDSTNLGTYSEFDEAVAVANRAFKDKPFTVRIINNRTGQEESFN